MIYIISVLSFSPKSLLLCFCSSDLIDLNMFYNIYAYTKGMNTSSYNLRDAQVWITQTKHVDMYRISDGLGLNMIFIQRVMCFPSPSIDEGIENTQ